MRENLLGLRLSDAMEMLRREGIDPQVTLTAAPRRKEAEGGDLRVVYASDDGRRLTAARFLNPIAFRRQENG